MPIVTIQVTREGVTTEQKAALIKGATDLLKDVLNKDPNLTFVIIQEVVEAVLYLEGAKFVTGETLHVDGGAHAGHW